MGQRDPPGSPLEVAAGAAGQHAVEAFDLLGNETRLAILLALWEAYDPHAEANAVPFSELRQRVGMRDSGQFNYHLDKLDDEFVRKTEGGYTLRPVGLELVQTVIAGTGAETTLPPTELDVPCDRCGTQTAITYRDGWLYQICTDCESNLGATNEDAPEGVLFMEPFSSAGLANRTPEAVFAAGVFRLLQVMTMKAGGLCPRCSGVVESSVDICDDHDSEPGGVCHTCGRRWDIVVKWVCTVCKYRGSAPPRMVAALHPASIAFYHDHGTDIGYPVNDFEQSKRVLSLVGDIDHELVSTDPLRVRATLRSGGEELRLTLDEEMTVVEVSETE